MNSKTFPQVSKWCMGTVLVTLLCASAVEAADEPDFFPLQVGNRWTYLEDPERTSPPDTLMIAIIDTQRVNGNLFYRFSESEALIIGGKLLRKDTLGDVIEYNPVTQQECLRFRLAGEEGERWEDCEGSPWLILPGKVADMLPHSNLLVRGKPTLEVTCDCFGPGMRFIDGLGLAGMYGEVGFSIILINAVIDGESAPHSQELDTLIRKDGWGIIKAMFLPFRK